MKNVDKFVYIFYDVIYKTMSKRIKHFLVTLIVYGLVLFLVDMYFPNIFMVESTVYWSIITYGVLSILFWILHCVIRWVLNVLTLPLKYITFGLSTMIMDMLMLYVFEFVVNGLDLWVTVHLWSMLAVFVFSLFLWLVAFLLKKIF